MIDELINWGNDYIYFTSLYNKVIDKVQFNVLPGGLNHLVKEFCPYLGGKLLVLYGAICWV